ncbi:hypothetical protein LTR85_006227 [Meristemomyces frigidus]|nr:hypothetical protein LTR85_006227 [Meristemomyces frigidus]
MNSARGPSIQPGSTLDHLSYLPGGFEGVSPPTAPSSNAITVPSIIDIPLSAADSNGDEYTITYAGHEHTILVSTGSASMALVDGMTLASGDALTADGVVYSLGSSGIAVAEQLTPGTADITFSPSLTALEPTGTDGPVISASAISHLSGAYVVNGITVAIGGPAKTVDGEIVSAASTGLSVAKTNNLVGTDRSVISISAISDHSGAYVVDGFTVSNGGPAQTVDGVSISAASTGLSIASTNVLLGMDGATLPITEVTGETGIYVADGTTIEVGGSVETVDGIRLSAATTGIVTVSAVQASDPTSSAQATDGSLSGAAAPTTSSTSSATQTEAMAVSTLCGLVFWASLCLV